MWKLRRESASRRTVGASQPVLRTNPTPTSTQGMALQMRKQNVLGQVNLSARWFCTVWLRRELGALYMGGGVLRDLFRGRGRWDCVVSTLQTANLKVSVFAGQDCFFATQGTTHHHHVVCFRLTLSTN